MSTLSIQGDHHTPCARRVMIVDDNEASAQTLTWAMELEGYNVVTCHDGPTAVKLAHDFHPDVVLLDIGMPDMDGYEVCRRLRGDETLNDVLVVAQTGWGSDDARRKTEAAGFNHHFTKPVDLGALVKLIGESVH